MKNVIVEIQRWSMSDGPGTRTVVFLKGCPLHCPWCANPESQSRLPQIGVFPSRCVACGACTFACPQGVAIPAGEGAFSEGGCIECGECVTACHARARAWMGAEMSAEQVVQLIKKDMVFYRQSSGGVTFSGGEPLLQPDFLGAMLAGCRKLGIHTAIETCGYFSWSAAQKAIGQVDFVLFDIKHMHPEKHKVLTGVTNQRILENARRLCRSGIPTVIRIPIIPSVNDSEDNIRTTARFVRDHLPAANGIEILPYHQLGLSKYEALGQSYKLQHIVPPDENHMQKLREQISEEGVFCITEDSGYEPTPSQPILKVVG